MKTLYAKDPTTWLTSLKCSRVKEHIHLPCMFFKWYQSLKLTSEKRIYHNFNLNTLICLTAHNNDRGTVIIQVLFPRIFLLSVIELRYWIIGTCLQWLLPVHNAVMIALYCVKIPARLPMIFLYCAITWRINQCCVVVNVVSSHRLSLISWNVFYCLLVGDDHSLQIVNVCIIR